MGNTIFTTSIYTLKNFLGGNMYNIAVIFGGRSTEHSISIITAIGAIKNLSLKYKPIPIYINTKGEWLTGEHLLDVKSYVTEPGGKSCFVRPNDPNLYIKSALGYKKIKIDCALLALHGGIYEGGAVQGALDLSGIPYTSPEILGSSVCMDKVVTKLLFKSLGINTTAFVWGCKKDADILVSSAKEKLTPPLIVKPARCGSSVGITRVEDADALASAIGYAGQFDDKIIVEEALTDFRELNIALLSDKKGIKFSSVEEVIFDGEIYTFDQKYSQKSTTKRTIPADINLKVMNKILKNASQIYAVLDLKGVVRLDFLVKDDKVYLNEINTIPGSFGFYLWRKEGLSFAQLLNVSIQDAIATHQERPAVPVQYNEQILRELDSIGRVTK